MPLDRFLTPGRVIDLKSRDFQSALSELLAACPELRDRSNERKVFNEKYVLEKLLQHERIIPKHLDNFVALPNVRLPIRQKYIFAVGRCAEGLVDSPDAQDKKIRVLFLVLASDREKSYHSVLTTLTRTLEETELMARLERSATLKEFREEIISVFKGVSSRSSSFETRFNRLMIREALKIAIGSECSSILVFADSFAGTVRVGKFAAGALKTIIVSERGHEVSLVADDEPDTIVVRAFSSHRLSQLRSALLVGLMRELIKPNDRVCCVGGLPGSDRLDSIMVVDVAREFPSVLLGRGKGLLPAGVSPEVLERALGIATELAVEGREGKPVGCTIVIGDRAKILPHTKPLILNPFFGYNEEDRNILNPFMDETVKELSSIDGAFIINGNGVIESAGSMLTATESSRILPGGLGTRHVAAAAISNVADCIAIAVSSSTGQVTLFRSGEPLVLLDRSANKAV